MQYINAGRTQDAEKLHRKLLDDLGEGRPVIFRTGRADGIRKIRLESIEKSYEGLKACVQVMMETSLHRKLALRALHPATVTSALRRYGMQESDL